MPEFKDYIAAFAVAVSAVSAGFAYYANTTSNNVKAELDQSKFTADTSIKLLEMTYTTLATADSSGKRVAACTYAITLAKVEEQELHNGEPLIRPFLTRMIEGGDVDPNCHLIVAEGLGSQSASAAPPTPVPVAAPPPPANAAPVDAGPVDALGTWHAVIASYDTTPDGCVHAKEDVERYRTRLPADAYSGATLEIIKTKISNNYAVTLDLGGDKTKAQEASRAIRAIGATLPTKEGADSFVQQNRGWSIDPSCDSRVTL